MKKRKLELSLFSLAITMLLGIGQETSAHTRFETGTVSEGVRITNNVVIGHPCGTNPVIGTSVVFPDGADSTVLIDGQPQGNLLTDFISNWSDSIRPLLSRAAFDYVKPKQDAAKKVVGFWAAGGPGMPEGMVAYVPFRLNAVNIAKSSCAKSVTFQVSIVDICQITGPGGLQTEGVVDLWTHNDLGTIYDSKAEGGPAPLKITRNLTANPLPESCGQGVDVTVKPSAAQINRDMPIVYEGKQIWPSKSGKKRSLQLK
ncbi:hypothetical protein [Nitrosomonas sp.]|uniref:hypothetical protein n=1 Tax=Nitrosomonas sp. TaxID=42353 RepID=UPI0025D8FBDE|nr:hypothetical protein [Nitrosomonas sp.]MCC6916091.1 hypothetical protein [Nitrosomonas sp.]